MWRAASSRTTGEAESSRRDRLADKLRLQLAELPPDCDQPVRASTAAIRDGLAHLSDSDRELIMLTGWDGLDPREAAVVLGIPPRTVRTQVAPGPGEIAQGRRRRLPPMTDTYGMTSTRDLFRRSDERPRAATRCSRGPTRSATTRSGELPAGAAASDLLEEIVTTTAPTPELRPNRRRRTVVLAAAAAADRRRAHRRVSPRAAIQRPRPRRTPPKSAPWRRQTSDCCSTAPGWKGQPGQRVHGRGR